MSNIKIKNNQRTNSNATTTAIGLRKRKNNVVNPNLSSTPTEAMITGLSENAFECIIKNIKAENFPLVSDESSDSENLTEIKEMSVNEEETLNKHENVKNMSNNVSGSNLQMQKNTNLLDTDPTENMSETSSLSTHQVLKTSLNTSRHTKLTHKCNECCEWCKKSFAIFDNPNHIGRIRNTEKQNALLKIEPTLNINSCLCDRCFKYLERVNKFNETEKRKGISNSNDMTKIDELVDETGIQKTKKKHKKRNRSRKRIGKADICSVHGCSRYSIHQISLEECTQIKKIFSTFDFSHIIFIESKKKSTQLNCPLSACVIHLPMLNVIMTCNLCGNNLDDNLDPEDWKMYDKWNLILLRNDIPLKLQPGMFICITCRSYISEDLFSTIDLEFFQRTVQRRMNVCIQLFGSSQDIISKADQVSDVDTSHLISPIVIANMPKSVNLTKIKFADPLITSTYYFTTDNSENHHKHNKGKNKSNCSNTEVKSIECTKTSDSSTAEENLEYDDYTNHRTSNLESHLEESNNSIIHNIEENNYETSMTKNSVNTSSNLYHNPRRFRILKMMGLLNKELHIKSEYLPPLLSENNEEQLPIHLNETKEEENFTDLTFSSNQNDAVTAFMNVEKDLLPSHVISILDGDENNLSRNEETVQYNSNEIEIKVENDDQNEPMIPNIHSNQNLNVIEGVEIDNNFSVITDVFTNQPLCNVEDVESKDNMSLSITKRGTVKDLETKCYEKIPEISSVFSQTDKIILPVISNAYPLQSKNRVNNSETYKNSAVVTGVYSDQSVCIIDDVDSDENSSVCSDQNMCIVNDVENIPVDAISVYSDVNMRGVEDVESGKEMPINTGIDSDQILYTATANPTNSKNSDPDNIFVEPLMRTNSCEIRKKLRSVICQRISKEHAKKRNLDETQFNQLNAKKRRLYNKATEFNDMLSNESNNKTNSSYNNNFVADSTNEDSYNSDSTDMSTTDEEISFMADRSIDQFNTDELPIQINSNLNPNYAGPIRFQRTLQKVDNLGVFKEVGTSGHVSDKNSKSGTDSVPSFEIMSLKEVSDKSTQDVTTHKYELFPQSHKLTNDELDKFQHLSHPEVEELEDDKLYDLRFQLDKSNSQIYRHLLNTFQNESLILSYLLENERMLYSKELVPSKTANKVTTDYLNKHLAALSKIYGDPKHNKANVSYLLDEPENVKEYSKRSTSQINSNSPSSTSTSKAVGAPVNHVYHVTNKPSTSSTCTKSNPTTTRNQVFNFLPTTRNMEKIPNFQSPRVFRPPMPNIPQTAIRSSFQLPTAVRTSGMFIQNNKSNCPLRPRSFTHNVRN